MSGVEGILANVDKIMSMAARLDDDMAAPILSLTSALLRLFVDNGELAFEIEVRDEALMACLRDPDAVRELIEQERQNLLDSRSASS